MGHLTRGGLSKQTSVFRPIPLTETPQRKPPPWPLRVLTCHRRLASLDSAVRRRANTKVSRVRSCPDFGLMVKTGGFVGGHWRVNRVLLEIVNRSLHVFNKKRAQVAADAVTHQDALN